MDLSLIAYLVITLGVLVGSQIGSRDATVSQSVNKSASIGEGNVVQIEYCGVHKDILFVLSDTQKVYKSDDMGTSFKSLSNLLNKSGANTKNTDQLMGGVSRLEMSPADPNMILFLGT